MPDIGDNTVYSQVDASNNTGTNPGWPEGMAPSRVNDAARALQGAVKRWRDYSTFSVTSGGVAATQTLTYAVAPSLQTNDEFGFIAGFIATAAMTLNINATGVKTVKKLVAGVLTDLVATDWAANDKVKVSYDGTFYVLMLVARISASLGANTFTGDQTLQAAEIIGSPTGGSKGAGTINVQNLIYQNGNIFGARIKIGLISGTTWVATATSAYVECVGGGGGGSGLAAGGTVAAGGAAGAYVAKMYTGLVVGNSYTYAIGAAGAAGTSGGGAGGNGGNTTFTDGVTLITAGGGQGNGGTGGVTTNGDVGFPTAKDSCIVARKLSGPSG